MVITTNAISPWISEIAKKKEITSQNFLNNLLMCKNNFFIVI